MRRLIITGDVDGGLAFVKRILNDKTQLMQDNATMRRRFIEIETSEQSYITQIERLQKVVIDQKVIIDRLSEKKQQLMEFYKVQMKFAITQE